MRFTTAAATHIGRRDNNEDTYGALPEEGVFFVSDGMGGHAGGEVAAGIVAETVSELISRRGPAGDPLEGVVDRANERIMAALESDEFGHLGGMGATLTAAAWAPEQGRLRVTHIGDCRLFLLRAGEMRHLTDDHTVAYGLHKSGLIPREMLMTAHGRNVLTHCIGAGVLDPRVDRIAVEIMPGDRLLFCSDGLTDAIPEAQVAALALGEPADRAAQNLVSAAYDAGGKDNITVLIVDCHDA
jgi:PPM family protein phosphatase